ncbi:MAG: hypothetical protein HY329_23065 [Chloroflexi bacterium]|nr:hypothetical protein [Chloroflexota bacterium]
MSGRATIVISHNLLTVREATTIVVLEDGRTVELGSHGDLVRGRGVYARLYGLHHSGEVATLPGRGRIGRRRLGAS